MSEAAAAGRGKKRKQELRGEKGGGRGARTRLSLLYANEKRGGVWGKELSGEGKENCGLDIEVCGGGGKRGSRQKKSSLRGEI